MGHLPQIGARTRGVQNDNLRLHYAHIYGKPYYRPLIDFMTSRPVIVSVWEGEEAVSRIRRLAGPTNSLEAPAGTIRGNYGDSVRRNIIHSSDSAENAKTEIARFFTKEEIFSK